MARRIDPVKFASALVQQGQMTTSQMKVIVDSGNGRALTALRDAIDNGAMQLIATGPVDSE